jgi:hypothetical protein
LTIAEATEIFEKAREILVKQRMQQKEKEEPGL